MVHIDFREVFKEIKEQYSEYINSPKIFGSIVQNNPSIIIQRKHSTINHFLKVETLRKTINCNGLNRNLGNLIFKKR